MEKMLINGYDKECMKMAMLKHEETFKQQVHELHRLYKIQKGLMEDQYINLNQIHDDHLAESIHETQLDLTLGPTSFYHEKKTVNKDLDRASSFSSSNSTSTGSSHREESRKGRKWDQGFQRSGNISFDIEEGKLNRHEKKDGGMPSWLYGAMSLKMS